MREELLTDEADYENACERLFILSQYACLIATSNQHIYIHTQILMYIHTYIHTYDLGIEKSCMCTGTPISGHAQQSFAKRPGRTRAGLGPMVFLKEVLSVSVSVVTCTHITFFLACCSVYTRYVCVDRL
jgi:hypothetical protein